MRKARLEYTVRFRDTDAQGVMYYGEYFSLFEMGRMEVLRQALGLDLEKATDLHRFAIAKATCEYRKPVRLGQKVYLETYLKAIGRSSLHFVHRLFDAAGHRVAEGDDVTVHMGAVGQPAPLTPAMRTYLEAFLGSGEDLPLHVVLGSANPGKRQAVWEAFWRAGETIRLETLPVEGPHPQPWGDDAIFEGAFARAQAALQKGQGHLGLGLESGLVERRGRVSVVGWCVAVAADGTTSWGRTVEVPLPDDVARGVRAGEHLEAVIDRLWGTERSGEKGGAMAFATRGLVTREAAWQPALWAALAPLLARPSLR